MRSDALKAALKAALPAGVAYALSDPRQEVHGLWPEEEAYLERAVEKRRREFAAGRRAARAALQALGAAPVPILRRESRAPIWPQGYTASLSHTDDLCIAIAAKLRNFRALGVDVESAKCLGDELANEVTRPDERAWMQDLGRQAAQVFSAKEAVYKMLCGEGKEILGFNDLRLEAEASNTFKATLERDLSRLKAGACFQVYLIETERLNLTFCFAR